MKSQPAWDGRGRGTATQYYPFQPDIVAAGKGLGNGYPVSAVLYSREAAARLDPAGCRYAQSHQNDPLGCAVAREVIAVMREENLVERSRKVGETFLSGPKQMADRHEIIKEARGRGLMIALELRSDIDPLAARTVFLRLLEQGLIVGLIPAANLLRFSPPLLIGEDDIQLLLDRLDFVISGSQ